MYCKYLLKRQRKYKPYFYCKALREEIILPCDKSCSKLILVANKPIKKVSNKRITVTEETYNKVMQRDKYKCRLCGTSLNLHLHHIMRSWKRLNKRYKQLYNFVSGIVI